MKAISKKIRRFGAVKIQMEYQYHTFANGLRLLHIASSLQVSHLGVFINVGSRHELANEKGMAHFVEHTLFKGTSHRKAFHIMNRLESVGGDMNAYTAKEETCIYASFLNQYYPRALELFSDILFDAAFPLKELEKEKQVVLDEIDSYKDTPAEQIMDDFEELSFPNHPLGSGILGNPKHIRKFNQQMVLAFMARNYDPSQMLISSVGNIGFEKLKQWVSKYFGVFPTSVNHTAAKLQAPDYGEFAIERKTRNYQTHCVIGGRAPEMSSPKRAVMALLNNITGGPSMTSRLGLSVRERHGYTYNIESGYNAYTDSGLMYVYFGTDAQYYAKVLDLVNLELNKLRTQALGTSQLHMAKQQFLGQFAIASESNSARMMAYGKQLLLVSSIDTPEDIYRIVQNITSMELLEAANQVFSPNNLQTIVFKSR
jgi:predicted Zn-dependent peptidase